MMDAWWRRAALCVALVLTGCVELREVDYATRAWVHLTFAALDGDFSDSADCFSSPRLRAADLMFGGIYFSGPGGESDFIADDATRDSSRRSIGGAFGGFVESSLYTRLVLRAAQCHLDLFLPDTSTTTPSVCKPDRRFPSAGDVAVQLFDGELRAGEQFEGTVFLELVRTGTSAIGCEVSGDLHLAPTNAGK